MRCPTSKQLAAYLDNAMSAQVRERIDVHLIGCADCRQEVEALEGTAQMLAQLPDPEMPDDLWAGVARRLPAAGGHAAWRDWWKALLGAGVATSMLLGILLTHLTPSSLPAAPASISSYVADHSLLSARDPLADRTGIGMTLVAQRGEK